MAKKQSSKKTAVKKFGGLGVFWNKHWQLILIAVLVVGNLGFIGVNKLIIYNQKQQFDQAEKSLDTLYASIVKDVGQPTSITKSKSCDYASTEGGRGSRSCGVDFVLKYKGNAPQSNALAKSLVNLLKSSEVAKVTYERLGLFKDGSSSTYSSDFAFDLELVKVMSKHCSLSANYFDKNGINSIVLENSYLEIGFGCSGSAKAEFYPVKN